MAELVALAGDVIGSSFPSPELAVAEVAGAGEGYLHWQPRMVRLKPEHSLGVFFYEFLQLADADDARVETAAKEYGPLGLCESHGLPMCHRGEGAFAPLRQDIDDLGSVCPPVKAKQGYLESIDKWRDYAKLAGATLRLAAELKRGEPGDLDSWRIVAGIDHVPRADELPLVLLAGAFTFWQWAADLRPMVATSTNGAGLRLWLVSADAAPLPNAQGRMEPSMGHRGGLFGILATHLMLATAGGPSLSWCASCSTLYRPHPAPRQGERHFCPACRQGNAKQRFYQREKRRANRLSKD